MLTALIQQEQVIMHVVIVHGRVWAEALYRLGTKATRLGPPPKLRGPAELTPILNLVAGCCILPSTAPAVTLYSSP